MKDFRKGSLTLIALVLIGLALFLYMRRHAVQKGNEVGTLSNGAPTHEGNFNQQAPAKAGSSVAANSNPRPYSRRPETNGFFEQIEPRWQMPIDFYGKVVDESNEPVADAAAQFNWTEKPAEAMSGPGETKTVFSGADGFFALNGARGPSLSVSVSKQGYYASRSNEWAFSYTGNRPFSPDSSNPVIFRLRKEGKPEPLMRLSGVMLGPRQYRLDRDGIPTDISFYTGKRVSQEESQFRVILNVSPPMIPGQRRFNWRCQISVPNGGLLATSDEFPFLAPEQGYQNSVEIDSDTNAWSDRLALDYYVRLPDGKYGRVKFNLSCRTGPYFGVEALINFNGSRDLEYDKYLPGNVMVDHSAP